MHEEAGAEADNGRPNDIYDERTKRKCFTKALSDQTGPPKPPHASYSAAQKYEQYRQSHILFRVQLRSARTIARTARGKGAATIDPAQTLNKHSTWDNPIFKKRSAKAPWRAALNEMRLNELKVV